LASCGDFQGNIKAIAKQAIDYRGRKAERYPLTLDIEGLGSMLNRSRGENLAQVMLCGVSLHF